MRLSVTLQSLVALFAVLSLPSCTTSKPYEFSKDPVELAPPSPTVVSKPSSFTAWKTDFIERAKAAGIAATDVERLILPVELHQKTISRDRQQAEFMKMPWEYIDNAVAQERIRQGQQNFQRHTDFLRALEKQYGVPAEIITAIWGLESSYGKNTGQSDLAQSLATLAYEGRRREFAEQQLLALLQLLARGDVQWTQLRGSWAGGMGETQFIPSTWLEQGIDGDRDGQRNPWATADALASTAHYLNRSGWQSGIKPFYEVRLPAGFDYRALDSKQTLSQWGQLGLTDQNGKRLIGAASAQLWLPAGVQGPALLLTKNFETIKVYNNSSNYALGISLLAERIAGKSDLVRAWPRHERPLSTEQVKRLQQYLTVNGYDTHGSDGILGTNSRRAFARWQADHGQVPDGFVSQSTTVTILN